MEKFLKSRYRIGEKMGESPFSVTYKGYLMGTEVPVVIKIYKRAALNSPLINKLRPKVTKIISLDHKNIARVIDGDYGWQGFYFVREYVEGENLDEFLLRGLPGLEAGLDIIKQVLSSLSVAHSENILHGAINNRNIFMTSGREVKLTDFILEPGVRVNPSLLAEAAATDAAYMSPEQIRGEQINNASDIYSTGVVLYQLLTGTLPYIGNGGLDTALQHISSDVEAPSRRNDSVPEYLDDIVLKMLEKDPLQRIGSASDVLDSLNNKRLVFKLPNQDLINLIYNEESEPIMYQEEILKKPKKIKPPKTKKMRRITRTRLVLLLILIAVASGLWYAFILSLINMR